MPTSKNMAPGASSPAVSEMPKSMRTGAPVEERAMLAGARSRCAMWCECRCATAEVSWRASEWPSGWKDGVEGVKQGEARRSRSVDGYRGVKSRNVADVVDDGGTRYAFSSARICLPSPSASF